MYLINRLKEPSTLAGVGMFAVLFGVPAGTVDIVVQAIAAVAAAGAVLLPESKGN